jgi:hypothetical protein
MPEARDHHQRCYRGIYSRGGMELRAAAAVPGTNAAADFKIAANTACTTATYSGKRATATPSRVQNQGARLKT